MSVSLVGGVAELRAKAFVERVEVDVFDGGQATVPAIELAPSLRFSDVDPIGCAVAGALESITVDEGFEQDGAIPVTVLPVAGQASGGGPQNAGRQVRRPHPRKNQEAGVVGNPLEVAPALLVVSADEPVASRGATFQAAAQKPEAAGKCELWKTR